MSENEALVHDALEHFGLLPTQTELIKTSNNLIYKVSTKDRVYALRIHQPKRRKIEWIESELMWLQTIQHDTNLRVPTAAAPTYIAYSSEKPVYCTLLHWVTGNQILPSITTPEQAQMLGKFIAQLHNQSVSFNTPPEFTLPHLDQKGMFGNRNPYQTEENKALFTFEQLTILDHIGEQVQAVMTILDQQSGVFGVIHADLIWKNILFDGDTIAAIDFDDCAYGYYLYDLAPTLLGYIDESHYPEIRTAIWDGYTSTRPLPNSSSTHLETLIAGRYALSCHWIAANRHNPAVGRRASEIIAYRTAELRRYLETGLFRRGEIII